MKIGLQIRAFNWEGSPENAGEKLTQIAQTAEKAGFDSIWTMDHFFQIEFGGAKAEDPMLEAYTVLSHMAAVTKKIKIGALVVGVIYRDPSLLIKAASTLDVLSGGRTYF